MGYVHPDQFTQHHTFGNVRERAFGDIWTDTANPIMIVSTRESQASRERVLELGISQISGASCTSVGGYEHPEAPEENSAQFDVNDTRTLDEVIHWLLELGYVPSFCTACYRAGRTGDRFMNYYPEDDPSRTPVVRWRSVANLLFANWLNYYVYQETPYELDGLYKGNED